MKYPSFTLIFRCTMFESMRCILLKLSLLLLAVSLETAKAIDTEVYLLHTNNTNGTLENCLCPVKQYGSLEKRILYIREWLGEHPNTIVVDAGDFLSATKNMLKDSITFCGMELIDYDAVGVGDQEFFHGIQFFKDMVKDSKLPFVSTNLVKPKLPGVNSKIIVERSGISFGILSVMYPQVFRFYSEDVQNSVSLTSYEEVLLGELTALKEKVDVIVLLSHLGIEKDRELAKTLQGIDIIVGSHTQTVLEVPEQVGNTLIVQAGKDGYYVGELRLVFDEDSRKINSYEGQLIPMDISLPNDPTMVDMIIEYNRLSRWRAGKRVERISPVPQEFLVASPDRCGTCHSDELDHWETKPHALSFETLKSEHKHKSPQCLVCHTTGFGRDDGYLNYNITAGLKTVNCTECHYVTGAHLTEPSQNRSIMVTEEKCIRCHDHENSPEFEFTSFVEKIRHPVVEIATVSVPESVEEKPPKMEFILHEIQTGECLWLLAERYLSSGVRWIEIYEANRDIIKDPDKIFVGQTLHIQKIKIGE